MTAYRYFWFITALLVGATIYAVSEGLIGWALAKFPELQGQLISVLILAIFLYAYAFEGYLAARLLLVNDQATGSVTRGEQSPLVGGTEVQSILRRAMYLRSAGTQKGQTDFSVLFNLMSERFDSSITAALVRIDTIRVFLFFAGLLFTVIGIVQGFASQQYPTNPEEAKLFSFTIIKALGLAYLPATECLGSTLILFVLSNTLQSQAAMLKERFDEMLYNVTFIGVLAVEGQLSQDPHREIEGGLPYAQTS